MAGRCGQEEKVWETVWEVDSQSLYSQANTKVTTQGNTKRLSGTYMGPTANPETLQLFKICRRSQVK